jgi:hypothetical protein
MFCTPPPGHAQVLVFSFLLGCGIGWNAMLKA